MNFKRILTILLLFLSIFLFACDKEENYAELQVGKAIEKTNVEIEGRQYAYIKYCLLNGGYIRVISAKTDGKTLVIPSRIQGYPVTEVGGDYWEIPGASTETMDKSMGWLVDEKQELNQLIISQGIREIYKEAFQGLRVRKVELPESLDVINSYAFANSEIDTVVVKSKDVMMGNGAFSNSTLKEIRLSSDFKGQLGDRCFENSNIESFQWPSYGTGSENQTGWGIFMGCNRLKEVSFPENQKHIYISEATFSECESLKKLVFPKSTKKVTFKFSPYADNCKRSVETLIFEGTDTKIEGCKYKGKGDHKFITVKRIVAPKKSKASIFAKKALRVAYLAEWIQKDVKMGNFQDNYSEGYGDDVKLVPVEYEEAG